MCLESPDYWISQIIDTGRRLRSKTNLWMLRIFWPKWLSPNCKFLSKPFINCWGCLKLQLFQPLIFTKVRIFNLRRVPTNLQTNKPTNQQTYKPTKSIKHERTTDNLSQSPESVYIICTSDRYDFHYVLIHILYILFV